MTDLYFIVLRLASLTGLFFLACHLLREPKRERWIDKPPGPTRGETDA